MVHQFKKNIVFFLICLLFSTNTYSQNEAKYKEIESDLIALKIGKKVLFLSELNQYLKEIPQLKCLKSKVLSLEAAGLKLTKYSVLEIDTQNKLKRSILISHLVKLLQLEQYINSLSINEIKLAKCQKEIAASKVLRSILLVEAYLRTRFVKENGLDARALKVFVDTIFQKISYEILL